MPGVAIYKAWLLTLLDGGVARIESVPLMSFQEIGRSISMDKIRTRLWGATSCGGVRGTKRPNDGILRTNLIPHVVAPAFTACMFCILLVNLLSVFAAAFVA